MSQELEYLSQQVALGRSSRRDFLGRAAALGLTAGAANALLASAAHAAGPRRGGTLKIGLQGGAATDSLDPALAANQLTFHVGRMWGEELVKLSVTGQLRPYLATEWRSSPDAKAWVFKIRKGVQFHNGKEMTPDDVVATMRRHSGPTAKSGTGHHAGRRLRIPRRRQRDLHAEGCQRRLPLPAHRLPPADPAQRRQ